MKQYKILKSNNVSVLEKWINEWASNGWRAVSISMGDAILPNEKIYLAIVEFDNMNGNG